MLETEDQFLIKEILRGNNQASELLVQRYLKPLYRFIFHFVNNSEEAEDLTQETFFRAWHNLKKFKPEKKFSTWLFAIAKNAALDFLKKKKALLWSDFENEDQENSLDNLTVDPVDLPDEIFDQINLKEKLQQAINLLPPAYRVTILLYYQDQLNFREISERLNEPIDTIKSRYRRGLIKLKSLIKQ